MKLLLTSEGFNVNGQKIFKEFVNLVGKPADEIRITLFSQIQDDQDMYYLNMNIDLINSLGIKIENIKYANICEKTSEGIFDDLDVIYMCGGNTFSILDNLRKNGYQKSIQEFVHGGGVYVGHSAGSIIAGPDIDVGVICNDDENHIGLIDTFGWNFVPFTFWPHFTDKYTDMVNEFKKTYNHKFFTLQDNEVIVVDGSRMRFIY